MIKVLEAINANREAWYKGEDYPPFCRDMRLGEAVMEYLEENSGKAYLMQQLAAAACQAKCRISMGTLYQAMNYYYDETVRQIKAM